jgi:hypothetical protein
MVSIKSTKNAQLVGVAIALAMLLTGCSTLPVYGPAAGSYSYIPTQNPIRTEAQIANKIYVGGGIALGSGFDQSATDSLGNTQTTPADNNFMAYGKLYRSHSHKFFAASYGAFLGGGRYKVVRAETLAGPKSYGVTGLFAELSVGFPIGRRFKWHLASAQLSKRWEWGQYAQFRRTGEQQGVLVREGEDNPFAISVLTEFLLQTGPVADRQWAFSMGFGGDINQSNGLLLHNISYQSPKFGIGLHTSTDLLLGEYGAQNWTTLSVDLPLPLPSLRRQRQ